jgi:hypothetical protein
MIWKWALAHFTPQLSYVPLGLNLGTQLMRNHLGALLTVDMVKIQIVCNIIINFK